jgi:hypothetical protein
MTTTATAVAPLAPLSRLDRCDRCSAAAQLRAILPSGELHFCGHHARQHRAGLLSAGACLSPDP